MTKATDRLLGELHGKLAKTMIAALEMSDTAEFLLQEYGEELPEAVYDFLSKNTITNPALLTSISKFLKDNDITCAVEDNDEMSDLEQRLKTKQRRRVGNVIPINE